MELLIIELIENCSEALFSIHMQWNSRKQFLNAEKRSRRMHFLYSVFVLPFTQCLQRPLAVFTGTCATLSQRTSPGGLHDLFGRTAGGLQSHMDGLF